MRGARHEATQGGCSTTPWAATTRRADSELPAVPGFEPLRLRVPRRRAVAGQPLLLKSGKSNLKGLAKVPTVRSCKRSVCLQVMRHV